MVVCVCGGGCGCYKKEEPRREREEVQLQNSFNKPVVPSLINISFILNAGWKYFYIREREVPSMLQKGALKIKEARKGCSFLDWNPTNACGKLILK